MPETVQISIPLPGEDIYSYSVPDSLKSCIQTGKRVIVPLGNRQTIGFVIGHGSPPDHIKLKEVIDVLDDEPLFGEDRLEFYRWISKYYMCPLGRVLKAAHPGVVSTGMQRIVVLTEAGLESLKKGGCGELERKILSTLQLSGKTTVNKIFSIVDEAGFSVLNSMRSRDLIEYVYEFREKVKKKYKKIVHPVLDMKNCEEIGRKPAKKAILDFLKQHGTTSLDDLKNIFPNPGIHLKWLEEEGYIRSELREIIRDPFEQFQSDISDIPELTTDQKSVLQDINKSVDSSRYAPFLLNGVTGSGKTEVYLRTIESVVARGKQAIVLVPEISLTPQLVKRFRARFGRNVAVIHSMLSDGERFDTWRMAREGRVNIVIGARSAIFTPFDNLGVIIVDEEHESSYKQDDPPCYNARDLSLVLGRMTGATVILGSATPSVESYYNSRTGKLGYLTLPGRAGGQSLPEVKVIDMKRESSFIFSRILKNAVLENYRNNNQTILFLNRRGYSTSLICENCGEIFRCPNCNISLTYHKSDNSIKCHYCGLDEQFSNRCNSCGMNFRGTGIGTQTVEQELIKLIPGARVHRMDKDSAGSKLKLMDIYNKLQNDELDVLIGTQMVAKGHDLPGVTLVGVISADMMLSIPDFRSGERTFQILTQVAGRAGRGNSEGTVVVQTYNQDHPSVIYAIEQNSEKFLESEMELRRALGYPPFTKMINVRFEGKDEDRLRDYVMHVYNSARSSLSKLNKIEIDIIGPSQCPVYRIKNRFRWQMILKSSDVKILHAFASKLYEATGRGRGNIKVVLDVDPQNFH